MSVWFDFEITYAMARHSADERLRRDSAIAFDG